MIDRKIRERKEVGKDRKKAQKRENMMKMRGSRMIQRRKGGSREGKREKGK